MHKCRKVSKLSFKLFLGVQDILSKLSTQFCSHLLTCFMHAQKQIFVEVTGLPIFLTQGWFKGNCMREEQKGDNDVLCWANSTFLIT